MRRIATRSARAAVRPARFGKTPGYSTGRSAASSGCWTCGTYSASFCGSRAFQSSFWPSGTITSLNSGMPSRETCTHGPDSEVLPSLVAHTALRRLAALQTPIADVGSATLVGHRAVWREHRDRDLDRDRVDVERLRRVDAVRRRERDQVRDSERPQPAEVEDRAEVDVERLVPLAGRTPSRRCRERLHAAAARLCS